MRILFIDTVHPFLKEKLESNKNICDIAYNKTKKEIENQIHIYDGIVIRSRFTIDKKFIDKAVKLKFIARAGSGLENINVKYANEKNIKCINAGEGNKQAVAEHAIGLLLNLFNNINKSDNEVRNGIWKREENRGLELEGKTISIIGYGNTGKSFANIIKAFNTKILVYDKYLTKYPFKSTMNNIYKNTDILSLNIPLTKETYHLINNKFISKFHKPFYLINTSRGKCVNTKHLVESLKTNKIKGVCLDVLENEKSCFSKLSTKNFNQDMSYLVNCNNTILTPHIAGWSKESNIKIVKILFKKIQDLNL